MADHEVGLGARNLHVAMSQDVFSENELSEVQSIVAPYMIVGVKPANVIAVGIEQAAVLNEPEVLPASFEYRFRSHGLFLRLHEQTLSWC